MLKYKKEMLIGSVPVLIAFLIFVKTPPAVMLIVSLLGVVAFYGWRSNGQFRTQSRAAKVRRSGVTEVSFDEIGGQERAKQELSEALDFLVKQEDAEKLGIRPLKGILLYGPPGTGKTLLARAAAGYTDAVFLAASGSEFVEMYVGVGAGRIRDLFQEARKKAKQQGRQHAVIFIDEIEIIGGKRDGGQQREYDQTLNQLLTEMDGIHVDEAPRILIIAATNRKEMLDSALLRPGRFDRHIGVELPDKQGRESIIAIHAQNKPIDTRVRLDELASETFGFSGAQLESVMNEAAIYAFRQSATVIDRSHLGQAIDKVLLGEKSDREASREEQTRVALHELGHAIAAEAVRPGSVSQVALSPRGQALGYVRHNEQQDKYLYTKSYLLSQLVIVLGGAAAEEIFYGERSTGSRGDFDQATAIVRTMIEAGLTELGIIEPTMVSPEAWNKTAAAILDEQMQRTKELLEEQRPVFEQSLAILVEREMLHGDEFRRMISQNDVA